MHRCTVHKWFYLNCERAFETSLLVMPLLPANTLDHTSKCLSFISQRRLTQRHTLKSSRHSTNRTRLEVLQGNPILLKNKAGTSGPQHKQCLYKSPTNADISSVCWVAVYFFKAVTSITLNFFCLHKTVYHLTFAEIMQPKIIWVEFNIQTDWR